MSINKSIRQDLKNIYIILRNKNNNDITMKLSNDKVALTLYQSTSEMIEIEKLFIDTFGFPIGPDWVIIHNQFESKMGSINEQFLIYSLEEDKYIKMRQFMISNNNDSSCRIVRFPIKISHGTYDGYETSKVFGRFYKLYNKLNCKLSN